MKFVDLKEEHIIEIVRLYEEHTSSLEYRLGMDRFGEIRRLHMTPQQVLEDLRKHRGYQEYRIGSRWDINSKIYFKTDFEGNVTVDFNSNFDPRDRQGKMYEEAEKAGEEFLKAAMKYLSRQ